MEVKAKVLDVSKFNTITNYDSVAKNIDGVIIRCGYRGYSAGNITVDPLYAKHISEFAKRNVPVGVYFFTTAITEAEAREEANWVVNAISGYKISFPIFVDSEYSNSKKNGRSDGLVKSTRTKMLQYFCEEVERLGYEAGVYASDVWFNSMVDLNTLKKYHLWVAKYSSASPKYVSGYDGWQYTSSATISGLSGRCDMSNWYVDFNTEQSGNGNVNESTDIPTSEFKAGDSVKLNNVALYASSSTSKIANYKTGTYYIWSDDIKNDRIRITNSKSNVGKAAGVTGWVKVSDLSGDGSISAGDKLTLKNVALYASSNSTKVATHKTGTYYVWSADVKNGRIRITNNKASVGKIACVTGWIDVDDI